MPEADSLIVTAELAVAFAGFAGVVVVLRKRSEDPSSIAYVRLFRLIEASLASIGFSLLPLVLYHLGLRAPALWSVSSGVMALYLLVIQIYLIRRFRRQFSSPATSWRFNGTLIGVQIAFFLLLLVNSLGVAIGPAFGPYFAAVAQQLGVAALMFSRVLLLPPEERFE
jgi:hypothetical protein